MDEGRIKKLCFTVWASVGMSISSLPCAPCLGFLGFEVHEEDSCPSGLNMYFEPLNGEGAGQWRHQECSQLVPASLQKLHTLEHSYILNPSCAQQVTIHLLNILLDPRSEPIECEWARFCEKDMSF